MKYIVLFLLFVNIGLMVGNIFMGQEVWMPIINGLGAILMAHTYYKHFRSV